ncbi:hypothetical protein [Nocardioides sp.]|uniref:hypothetical protein n=1 Tax=Nocardioides sp. TaxID=35761 RepID=UPI002606C835|nr:hypothetical protein [Nocardioides sp.]
MRRTVLLPIVLAWSLTACGGSDPEATPSPEAPATAAVDADSTAPGTELDFGDAATLVWQPATSLTGTLDLSVDAVAEQSPSVFDGWVRDDATARARPYFVTVSLSNTGETDLAGQEVPLYLRDANGTLGAPWTLGGDFTACQSGPMPTPFAPGDAAEMCLVYLVPDGARIIDMVFEPTEGYDPIVWTGEVAKPVKASAGKPGRPARKKRGNG